MLTTLKKIFKSKRQKNDIKETYKNCASMVYCLISEIIARNINQIYANLKFQNNALVLKAQTYGCISNSSNKEYKKTITKESETSETDVLTMKGFKNDKRDIDRLPTSRRKKSGHRRRW